MNFLKAPVSSYGNQHDRERFNLSWSVYMFLVPVFILLAGVQYMANAPDTIFSILALIHSMAMLVMLYYTRRFFAVAIITGIVGLAINQANIYTVYGQDRLLDVLWIFVVSFYLFYTIGVRWGILSLVVNLAGLFAFIMITSGETMIIAASARTPEQEISMVVSALVSTVVICYLLYRIVSAARRAEEQLTKTNQELLQQNEQIAAQNEEKSVLLKEVHHRVKNNLQVITSMLNLQAGDRDEPALTEQLQEAVGRIASMSLIHEKMYNSRNLATISLKDYLQDLVQEIVSSHSGKAMIHEEIDTELASMTVNQLVPVALIVNELVTNSVKHAFDDKEEGSICIRILDKGAGRICLLYTDDGKWVENGGGFGLDLIDILTDQLDGSLQHETQPQTRFTLDFNL